MSLAEIAEHVEGQVKGVWAGRTSVCSNIEYRRPFEEVVLNSLLVSWGPGSESCDVTGDDGLEDR